VPLIFIINMIKYSNLKSSYVVSYNHNSQNFCSQKNLSVHFQLLSEGAVILTLVFKQTSSVGSVASVSECLTLLLALDPGHLTLFLEE